MEASEASSGTESGLARDIRRRQCSTVRHPQGVCRAPPPRTLSRPHTCRLVMRPTAPMARAIARLEIQLTAPTEPATRTSGIPPTRRMGPRPRPSATAPTLTVPPVSEYVRRLETPSIATERPTSRNESVTSNAVTLLWLARRRSNLAGKGKGPRWAPSTSYAGPPPRTGEELIGRGTTSSSGCGSGA
jgi:hypothetical protein